MLSYLRRLATTGIAYTASSVFSKAIAVLLLPIYTALLSPAEYGQAEVLFGAVVAASIVVRFGVIEALLRFYYLPGEDGSRVVSTGFAAIFWASTAGSLVLLPLADPIAVALRSEPDLVRIAIGGLWLLTLYEYMVTLYRLDERAKAYFFFTFANVLAAIPLTLILIAGLDEGARGLLLGSYASAIPFVGWLIFSERHRLSLLWERSLLRRMLRFGLPTMPAELSLYSLIFVDRIIIVRAVDAAAVGLYALAFKFSQVIQVFVRGFQLAWPPLAYSIIDDSEARRVYSVVLTAFVAFSALIVSAMWLEARWIVRLLAAPEFFDAYEVIGPLTLGAALYGAYLALLVVLGRTGRTEFNFPATLAALGANVGLNLWLVPELGILGAGIALVVSYAISLVLMLAFTQRLFPVPWQWGRLALIAASGTALVALGNELLPTDGAVGLLSRAALWAIYPVILYRGALSPSERETVRRLARPSEVRRRIAVLRERAAEPGAVAEPGGETIEAELRDEDRRSF
jgi:O-antigen/teichoic acid export membrane protein